MWKIVEYIGEHGHDGWDVKSFRSEADARAYCQAQAAEYGFFHGTLVQVVEEVSVLGNQ